MDKHLVNVVITRDQIGLQDVLGSLHHRQFNVVPCGTMNFSPVPLTASLECILRKIDTFDFIVFTSQIAVVETMKHLQRMDVKIDSLNDACVCVVGPVTAQSLAGYGVPAQVTPTEYTARALAELFPVMRCLSPRVLFLRGNWASEVISRELTRKGYDVTSAVVYEASMREQLAVAAERIISSGRADCIAFTSPSSVLALEGLIASGKLARQALTKAVIASIGPTTSCACADAGLTVSIQPYDYTLQGLAKAISRYFSAERQYICN